MPVVVEPEKLPVQQAKAGDPEAWNVLFKRYQLPLYAYVFELVRDEQQSLDIVQETFINAVRHIGKLRDDAKFGGWLFGIAHQKCAQLWRRGTRAEDVDELVEDSAVVEDAPDEWLIRREDEEEFMTALNQLPPPQRSVLLLFFVEEFSLEQIAEISGVTIGTVKSRMHYGKRALKNLLKNRR